MFSLALGLTTAVQAQVATSTQLTIPVATVAVGVPALLTATVTDAASHSVHSGTVTFYDGTRSLGSAQLVALAGGSFAQGTARVKTASFARGTNSITAVFSGTATDAASTSAAKTITVTGKNGTILTLIGPPSQGQSALTAQCVSLVPASLPATVGFTDVSSDTSLGSIALGSAAWSGGLLDVSSPAGLLPGTPAAGDFNGDGHLDLITPSVNCGVTISLGNGDGTLGPAAPTDNVSDSRCPREVAAADFNNDGKLDAVFIGCESGASLCGVFVSLGNGDGTFQPRVRVAPEEYFADMKVADLNGDGNLDLATVVTQQGSTGEVIVLLGNGDGTFQYRKIFAASNGVNQLAVGDLNGDGIPDVVATSAYGPINVLLGNGDGSFQPFKEFELLPPGDGGSGSYSQYPTLVDANGDGKLDLFLTGGGIIEALGKGDGTFSAPVVYGVAAVGQPILTDFDQDGKLDIVVPASNPGDPSDSDIDVLFGKTDGSFRPPVLYRSAGYEQFWNILVEADMNGDGRPDLIGEIGSFDAPTTFLVMLNHQTATVQLPLSTPFPGMVQASYAGDDKFQPSVSNVANLASVDFSDGFAGSSAVFQRNGSAVLDGATLKLTTGGTQQAGSAFTKNPVNIEAFTTDFTFQILNPVAEGLTFAIQNDSPTALGGAAGGLGYYQIPKSAAIKFDINNNVGEGSNSTGLFLNGAFPGTYAVSIPTSTIDLHSQHPIQVHMTYDGNDITWTMKDTVTLKTYSQTWGLYNITSIVGGPTAYVGFTASTGTATSTETVTSWTYTSGAPAPNYPTGFFLGAGTGNLNFSGAARTGAALEPAGGTNAAGSIFYSVPQNIHSFATTFAFQITQPMGDGLTFTIQNQGSFALGSIGGGLGYKGISNSVAVKFDIYDNAGEGPNSTGLYTDGDMPDVPAINLTGTGLDLHSGHPFEGRLNYNGTLLTLSLTDITTKINWKHSWPIDIPSTVGGQFAYVGFTGATGGQSSTQQISRWTFTPGSN